MAKSYRKFLAGSISAAVVASGAPILSQAATDFTDDIPSWALDAVNHFVKEGVIAGYPDGSYQADSAITRGEAAKILALALDLEIDDNAKASFSDAKNHWASKYIAALEKHDDDIIGGYGDGSFKPDNTITRQELAKVVVEAFDLEADDDADVDFSDNNSWGKEYVSVLASLGIVDGVSPGKFDPEAHVTRGQAPVFLYRTIFEDHRIKKSSKSRLSIEGDDQGNELANGKAKTYTVTYKDTAGKPIQGATLNVTFEENLLTNGERQRNVTVTNSDNQSVIPYQSSDGEEVAAEIRTNKDGKATFTVTGTNETVTPIVFVDGSNQEDDRDTDGGKDPRTQDDRFDQDREIYAKAKALTFGLTKYKIEVEGKRTNFAAIDTDWNFNRYIDEDEENGREYKIKVTKPDGTPFAGGFVNVGIEEYVDDILNNNPSDAYFHEFDGRQGVVKLDAKGEAKVNLASTKANDSAKPIVWIDQNVASNAQSGKLEKGEPVSDQSKVPYTNFQPSRVEDGALGAKLQVLDLTDEARDEYFYDNAWNVEDVKGFRLQLLNQSGKPFLPPTKAEGFDQKLTARATFTIENTGTHTIRVHPAAWLDEPVLSNAQGADDTDWDYGFDGHINRYVDIYPGGTVTIAGNIVDQPWSVFDSSATVAVYSLDGASSATVTGSAVVDGESFDFWEDYPESDSVAVGPVSNTATFANSANAPKLIGYYNENDEYILDEGAVVEKDTNLDGNIDEITLTFDEDVENFEAGDFRLVSGTTDIKEDIRSVSYGTKEDTSKENKKKIVLKTEEFDGLGISSIDGWVTSLYYDPSFSGDKALSDEFGNKVKAFIVDYDAVVDDEVEVGEVKDPDFYTVSPK